MTSEMFLTCLFIISVFTGLVTEAIKNICVEFNRTYRANIIAGIVAIGLSIAVWGAYVIMMEVVLNLRMIVYLIALVFLSWLSAMVGYDKIIQAINQIKSR